MLDFRIADMFECPPLSQITEDYLGLMYGVKAIGYYGKIVLRRWPCKSKGRKEGSFHVDRMYDVSQKFLDYEVKRRLSDVVRSFKLRFTDNQVPGYGFVAYFNLTFCKYRQRIVKEIVHLHFQEKGVASHLIVYVGGSLTQDKSIPRLPKDEYNKNF